MTFYSKELTLLKTLDVLVLQNWVNNVQYSIVKQGFENRVFDFCSARGHNGQFYIESRKIIFSGPKFVSNSFDYK